MLETTSCGRLQCDHDGRIKHGLFDENGRRKDDYFGDGVDRPYEVMHRNCENGLQSVFFCLLHLLDWEALKF